MKKDKNITVFVMVENICTYIVVSLGLVFSRRCLNTDKMKKKKKILIKCSIFDRKEKAKEVT